MLIVQIFSNILHHWAYNFFCKELIFTIIHGNQAALVMAVSFVSPHDQSGDIAHFIKKRSGFLLHALSAMYANKFD